MNVVNELFLDGERDITELNKTLLASTRKHTHTHTHILGVRKCRTDRATRHTHQRKIINVQAVCIIIASLY